MSGISGSSDTFFITNRACNFWCDSTCVRSKNFLSLNFKLKPEWASSKLKNALLNAFFLHTCKFFTTFANDSYARGSMSREKRFAKVLSWVGFGHIKIAFIDAFRFVNKQLEVYAFCVSVCHCTK